MSSEQNCSIEPLSLVAIIIIFMKYFRNIGGDISSSVPPTSSFGGDRPPLSPLSLRPCYFLRSGGIQQVCMGPGSIRTPTGLVLAPLLSILYYSDIITLLTSHGALSQFYADDTQVCLYYAPLPTQLLLGPRRGLYLYGCSCLMDVLESVPSKRLKTPV